MWSASVLGSTIFSLPRLRIMSPATLSHTDLAIPWPLDTGSLFFHQSSNAHIFFIVSVDHTEFKFFQVVFGGSDSLLAVFSILLEQIAQVRFTDAVYLADFLSCSMMLCVFLDNRYLLFPKISYTIFMFNIFLAIFYRKMSCFSLSIYIYREDINSRKKAHSKRITILQAILRRSKINHIKLRDTQEAKTPILYLNTFSNEGQKVFEAARAIGYPPFTLAAISDLDWNHIWRSGTVQLFSKTLSPSSETRTSICNYWWRRLFQQQKKKLPATLR